MKLEHIKAIFLLVNVAVISIEPIPNEYRRDSIIQKGHWWLIQTKLGGIKIGRRSHVINIDWTNTPYRGLIHSSNYPNGNCCVHASGYGEVITCLCQLFRNAENENLGFFFEKES
jgi:hypothetical protein